MTRLKLFFKNETVLCCAFIAAMVSFLWVDPSKNIAGYIDFPVLMVLFSLMVIIAGFRQCGLFEVLSRRLTGRVQKARHLDLILMLLCFLGAMFITNDVALILFVPLALSLLPVQDDPARVMFVVTLQTVAANLGSMATPVGNPQNIYLYLCYGFSAKEFFRLMLPPTVLSLFLLLAVWWLGEKLMAPKPLPEATSSGNPEPKALHTRQAVLWGLLFLLALAAVFRLVPHWLMLAAVLAVALFLYRPLLWQVDYGLLATFVCFFIFVGNLKQIPSIQQLLGAAIAGKELAAGVVLSQIISNVPAAMVLSSFTADGEALLLGTNFGGLGTLVGSLASLISYKLYVRSSGARSGQYLMIFSVINFVLLGALCLWAWIFL